MNVPLQITRDGRQVTVDVDCMKKGWIGTTCGFEPDPIVFAQNDTEGRFPMVLSMEELERAKEAAWAIWGAK